MRYTVTSDNASLIYYAFFDEETGDIAADLVSESSTEIVITNQSNGAFMTIGGTGLQLGDGSPVAGTVTSLTSTEGDLTPIGAITDISWDFVAFDDMLGGLEEDDSSRLVDLVNLSSEIVIDLRDATGPIDLINIFDDVAAGVTVGYTVLDSVFDAALPGTSGNDRFDLDGPTDNFNYVFIEASAGDDTIDGAGANPGLYVDLGYGQYDMETVNPIDVVIDTGANTGTISYGAFTDTIVDVRRLLTQTDGFGIEGSALDDSFDMTLGAGVFGYITGREGVDSYDLTLGDGASLRLSFGGGANGAPSRGVVVDLGGGTIGDDGFGNTESVALDVTGTGRIELRGTDFADLMIGSDGRESFIAERGDDTMDGGDGYDRVRYDRRDVDAVTVDLEAGTATGVWEGQAFTHELVSIEAVRGSREGGDLLTGSNADEGFDGRGGADTISAGHGDDEVYGGAGEDEISLGGGEDYAEGGDDNDLIRGNAGEDTIFGNDGDDALRGQKNGDVLDGGTGDDNLKGGGGNDTLLGGEGRDFLNGGSRADSIEGGDGRDKLIGRSFNDTLIGGEGNDRLNAGGDDDVLEGGAGNDVMKGGTGSDTFVFYNDFGSDRIIDADFSEDVFEIAADIVAGRSGAEIEALAVSVGNDMVLDLSADGATNVIRFSGLSDLDGFAEALVVI